MAIWHILWPFGKFFPFWLVVGRKIWQPCPFWFVVERKIWQPGSLAGFPVRECAMDGI
jgi:hypothetical protein